MPPELDRRGAVVFVHPGALPGPTVDGMPPFAADFLLDTTRAAWRLVQSGFVRRFARTKIILSHAGGFVPYASHRMTAVLAIMSGRSPADVLDDFASFYFDTALSGSPAALRACSPSRSRATSSSAATGRTRRRPSSATSRDSWTRTRGSTTRDTPPSTTGAPRRSFRGSRAVEDPPRFCNA
jgi:hypothetical protein